MGEAQPDAGVRGLQSGPWRTGSPWRTYWGTEVGLVSLQSRLGLSTEAAEGQVAAGVIQQREDGRKSR